MADIEVGGDGAQRFIVGDAFKCGTLLVIAYTRMGIMSFDLPCSRTTGTNHTRARHRNGLIAGPGLCDRPGKPSL